MRAIAIHRDRSRDHALMGPGDVPCTRGESCALEEIVLSLRAERDECRAEQNGRAWRRILAGAGASGDELSYDGDLLSL